MRRATGTKGTYTDPPQKAEGEKHPRPLPDHHPKGKSKKWAKEIVLEPILIKFGPW